MSASVSIFRVYRPWWYTSNTAYMSVIVSDSVRNRFRTDSACLRSWRTTSVSVSMTDCVCVDVRVHFPVRVTQRPCSCSWQGHCLRLTVFVLVNVSLVRVWRHRSKNEHIAKNVRQIHGRRHGLRPHEHVSLPLLGAPGFQSYFELSK